MEKEVNIEWQVKRELVKEEQEAESDDDDDFLSGSLISGFLEEDNDQLHNFEEEEDDGGGVNSGRRRQSLRNKGGKRANYFKEDDDSSKEEEERIVRVAIKRELEEEEEETEEEDEGMKKRKGRRPRTLKEARTEEEREWVREQSRKAVERRRRRKNKCPLADEEGMEEGMGEEGKKNSAFRNNGRAEGVKKEVGGGSGKRRPRSLKEAKTEEEREWVKEQIRKAVERRRRRNKCPLADEEEREEMGEDEKRTSCDGGKRERAGGVKKEVDGGSEKRRPRTLKEATTEEEREWVKEQIRKAVERRRRRKMLEEREEMGGNESSSGERKPRIVLKREGSGKRPRSLKEARSEEERERIREQLRRGIERRRERYKTISEEKKREIYDKAKIWRIMRKARTEEDPGEVDEDEKRRRQMENYLKRQAYWANMGEEKRRQMRERGREMAKRRWEALKGDEEKMRRLREKRRRYFREMEGERRERHLEKMRSNARRYLEEKRKVRMIQEGGGRIKKKGGRRLAWGGLGEEDKRRLNLLRDRRNRLMRRLKVQEMMDKGISLEEIMQQIEPPERRHRRLLLQRLEKARRTLKTSLLKEGASPEVITCRLEELKANYQPIRDFRVLAPRKRVDPRELEAVEAELEQLESKRQSQPRPNRPRQPKSSPPTKNTAANLQKVATIRKSAPKTKKAAVKKKTCPETEVITASDSQMSSFPPCLQPAPSVDLGYNDSNPPQAYYSAQNYYQRHPPPPPPPLLQNPYNQPSTSNSSLQAMELIGGNHQPCQQGHPPQSSTTSSIYEGYEDDGGDHHTYDDNLDGGDDHWEEFHEPPQKIPPKTGNPSKKNSTRVQAPRFRGYQPETENPPKTQKRRRKPTSNLISDLSAPKRPRRKHDELLHNCICELCGESFTETYINIHRKHYHNPHFDPVNLQCLLCSETFRSSQKWYTHFRTRHTDHYTALNGRKRRPLSSSGSAAKLFVCSECGKSFTNSSYFREHVYFQHGEGQKPENRLKCPAGNCDGRFTTEKGRREHVKKFHGGDEALRGWTNGKHRCWRCGRRDFGNERELKEHVKEEHPQHCFPCEWCGVVRFTQMALNFHYSGNKCARVPKGWKEEGGIKRVEGWEWGSLEKGVLSCEICGKGVSVMMMTFHYETVHNVVEERRWKCLEGEGDCEKIWRRREFVAVHMEEAHGWGWEEIKERLRKMNGGNREGMRTKGRPKRRIKWREKEDKGRGRGRRRRNVKVICEEEEGEDTHL